MQVGWNYHIVLDHSEIQAVRHFINDMEKAGVSSFIRIANHYHGFHPGLSKKQIVIFKSNFNSFFKVIFLLLIRQIVFSFFSKLIL